MWSLNPNGFSGTFSSVPPLPFPLPLLWCQAFPVSPLHGSRNLSRVSFPSLCFDLVCEEVKSFTVSRYLSFHSVFLLSHVRGHIPARGRLGVPLFSCLWGSVESLRVSWNWLAPLWLLASSMYQDACLLNGHHLCIPCSFNVSFLHRLWCWPSLFALQ